MVNLIWELCFSTDIDLLRRRYDYDSGLVQLSTPAMIKTLSYVPVCALNNRFFSVANEAELASVEKLSFWVYSECWSWPQLPIFNLTRRLCFCTFITWTTMNILLTVPGRRNKKHRFVKNSNNSNKLFNENMLRSASEVYKI